MTEEEAIAWVEGEDVPDYTQAREEEIIDQRRWSVRYEQVVHRISDGTFWKIFWDRGATEYQDGQELNIDVMQVEPYEQVVIKYRKKK